MLFRFFFNLLLFLDDLFFFTIEFLFVISNFRFYIFTDCLWISFCYVSDTEFSI